MDLVLYQLNISGLTISTVMIAMFFAVLGRSIRRSEMRWWTMGWIANICALAITSAFWYFQPPAAVHGLVFSVYIAAKSAYVWLMLRGALEFRSWRPSALSPGVMVPVTVLLCAAAVPIVNTRDELGLAANVAIAAGFGAGAFWLARGRVAHSTWIVIAFAARAALAAVEAAAYGVNVMTAIQPSGSAFLVPANAILAAHYSLDIGAEWLVAMGCVIGVSARAQQELRLANEQMFEAQAGLRRLADRDPLTALANRRALPDALRAAQPAGATLIFFDLDGFKLINDQHGHQAGDRCLTRFADALTHCFRPADTVVRYAGDEFLVVASGLDEAALADRISAIRARLAAAAGRDLRVGFSYGFGHLAPGGNPDEALAAADASMYRAKEREAAAVRTSATDSRRRQPSSR